MGIDPGLTGALAVVNERKVVLLIEDLPRHENTKWLDVLRLYEILFNIGGYDLAVLEEIQPLPSTGKSGIIRGSVATMSLARTYGQILAVLQMFNKPFITIKPSKWKAYYGLTRKGKEAGRLLAIQKFPDAEPLLKRKKDHNRADALLLALYGKEH